MGRREKFDFSRRFVQRLFLLQDCDMLLDSFGFHSQVFQIPLKLGNLLSFGQKRRPKWERSSAG